MQIKTQIIIENYNMKVSELQELRKKLWDEIFDKEDTNDEILQRKQVVRRF